MLKRLTITTTVAALMVGSALAQPATTPQGPTAPATEATPQPEVGQPVPTDPETTPAPNDPAFPPAEKLAPTTTTAEPPTTEADMDAPAPARQESTSAKGWGLLAAVLAAFAGLWFVNRAGAR